MSWDFTRHAALFNTAVETREWSAFLGLFAPDATMELHGPPVPAMVGRDAIAAGYAADPPDDTIALVGDPVHDGDHDTTRFRWRRSGLTGTMQATEAGGLLTRLVVAFD